jgi:hypothetical protein
MLKIVWRFAYEFRPAGFRRRWFAANALVEAFPDAMPDGALCDAGGRAYLRPRLYDCHLAPAVWRQTGSWPI